MPDFAREIADQLAGISAAIRKHDTIARAVLEASPDGTIVTDSLGQVVSMNQAAEVLSGFDREELIGKPIEALVPQELRAAHRERRLGYYIHPEPREMASGLNLSLKTKDGTLLPVLIKLFPARSGEDRYVVAVVRKRPVGA